MQRSNHSNNNINSRQSSSLSSSSTSSSSSTLPTNSGSSGRRSYNRSHNNNFKFHNFVFNETNQKFCLEEQHGNKKITVMHWKKSDDPKQQQSKSNSEFEQIRQVRNCDSDSKLIKSEKFRYIPDLLDRYRKETQDENISTEEEMIINDDDHRLNTGVASSASFPLATFRHTTIDDVTTTSDKKKIDPTISISKLPSLPHQSETSSFSSGHSSASYLSPSLLESSSSSYNNFNRSDTKNSDDSLISKSYYSGSSIATTSSSSCSGINYSLDNLKLNENRYCSSGDFGSNSSASGRRKLHNRVYNHEGDSEEEEEEEDDSDFDTEDIFYQTYRQKIRQKIENLLDEVQSQPLDLSIKKDYNNNNNDDDDNFNKDKDNTDTSFTTKLDDDTISACESVDSLMSTRLSDSPTTPITTTTAPSSTMHSNINRFGSYYFDTPGSSNSTAISSSWLSLPEQLQQQQQQQHYKYQTDTLLEKMRTESLSPSELLSSMKCCSPLSTTEETTEKTKNEKSVPTSSSSSSSNPFMFPHERTKMFESFEPIINDQHYSHFRTPTPTTTTTAAEMFDALVEEEIQKFLQNSAAAAASSSSSTSSCSSYNFNNRERYSRHQHHRRQSDLSKKIEDKLKLLQQEVLQNKLSESNFLNFISDPQNTTVAIDDNSNSSNNNNSRIMDDDYLRMHFKFDSNKNLEPYFMDGYRTRLGSSSLANRFLNPIAGTSSSSNSNSFGSSNSILAKNRRNQIKRHLEDSFKQNGFLVKTKQVSDANNSAMFCKFRQLRKYTRYYLKSWQNHLPDEVNKLWKGFLPPKSERPLFLTSASSPSTSPTSLSSSSDDILASNAAIAASINSCTAAILAATAAVESIPTSSCLLAAIDGPSPPSLSPSLSSSSPPSKVTNTATTTTTDATLSTSSLSQLMPPSSME